MDDRLPPNIRERLQQTPPEVLRLRELLRNAFDAAGLDHEQAAKANTAIAEALHQTPPAGADRFQWALERAGTRFRVARYLDSEQRKSLLESLRQAAAIAKESGKLD